MAKGFGLGNIIQGLAGNLNQMDPDTVRAEFGKYLLNDEEIFQAFTLVRDIIIFTNIRMIFFDKQGATGKKMSLKSIFLMNVIDCEMETSGTGFDDSEITITYMTNVKRRSNTEALATYKFEFPKKAEVDSLYRWLFELAYKNRLEINEIS